MNVKPQPSAQVYRQFFDHTLFEHKLASHLYSNLLSKVQLYDMIFVCIGTDRSTGDALGPLVGSKINALNESSDFSVYGTLDEPVHAINLAETITTIQNRYAQPYIIAIDACLGHLKHIGMITLGKGPLQPGTAVKKQLPAIGDMHMTGVVNVHGFMEFFVLQNTRLALVMNMATKISRAILTTTTKLQQKKTDRMSQTICPL